MFQPLELHVVFCTIFMSARGKILSMGGRLRCGDFLRGLSSQQGSHKNTNVGMPSGMPPVHILMFAHGQGAGGVGIQTLRVLQCCVWVVEI